MKKKTTKISFILLLISLSSVAQQKTQEINEYEEDLSTIRTSYIKSIPNSIEEGSYNTVNEEVDLLIDSIAKLNKHRRHLNGYTILIYSGQSRHEALAIKSKIVMKAKDDEIENFDVSTQYNQPNFLATTGEYTNKLQAQRDLFHIKKHFPKAILIPKKILFK